VLNSKEIQCIQTANDFRIFYADGTFEKMWLIVRQYKQKKSHPPLPETKTVLNLWHLHGVDCGEYREHRAISLLNQWLDILYGKGTAVRLNIGGHCERMWARNIKTNMPFYRGEDAPHFHFRNPFDSMLEKVSEELPPYA